MLRRSVNTSSAMVAPVFLGALLLVGVGCTRTNTQAGPPGGNPNSQNPVCQKDSDCPTGQACSNNQCVATCQTNADCQAGYHCVAGSPNYCAQDTTNPTVKNCTGDADCGAGSVCITNVCATACTADAACGPGASCLKGRCYVNGQQCGTANLVICTADDQCGTGRKCVSGSCRSQCAKAADCAIGQSCDATGVCSLEQAPTPAQCTFDKQCGGLGGSSYKCIDGACHPKCAADDQCSSPNKCIAGVCRASYARVK